MRIEHKLDKSNIENIVELTSLQQGMIFHYINDDKSTEYHEQLSLTITGILKIDLLQKAWDFVIENNEMLRTIFRWKGIAKPIQVVLKKHQVLIQYMDFTNELDKFSAVENIKLMDLNNRINITKEALRIYLCKLEECKYEMIISNHHILYDGWSNGIILNELMKAYTHLYEGREPRINSKTKFSEFVKYLNNLDKVEQKKHWTSYLHGLVNKDDCFESKVKGVYKEISYKITHIKSNKIKDFAKENRILLSSLLYGAWGVLIQKFTNSNEVMFGTTVSGRPESIKLIDNMVGLFINTIPIRIKSESNTTLINLIRSIEKMLNERKDFENTSLVDIKEYCGLRMDENLFNSIVSIENYPLDLNLNKESALEIENFSIVEKTNYNMSLEILTFEELEFKFNFNSEAINESIVQKLGEYLERIIDTLLNNQDTKISQVDLLSEIETKQILFDFNDIKLDYTKDKTVYELFEEEVEKAPDNVALIFEDKKLTYRELNEKSNSLARVLRNKGVKADSVVAIMVERSPEMIIGVMAILKAGGAYLPIDPSYPKERIEYILDDSEGKVLLSTDILVRNINYDGDIIDLYEEGLFNGDLRNIGKINNSGNLAYVIYTSGTTGNPKGVMIEHLNLNNFIFSFTKQFERGFSSEDNILSLTNYVFDVSVCEFFSSLINGATLVINDKHKTFDPIEIGKLIVNNEITFTYIPPSLLVNVYDELKLYRDMVKLRKLLVGVEAIRGEILNKFHDLSESIEIINGYGPTEATICSTFYKVTENEIPSKDVSIGRSIGNSKIYILDNYLKAVPIGVTGELYVSGDGVGRGYLNQPKLTAEKFIDNPFEIGTKMYKTGDLAKWSFDGNIEFLGRIDNQVKIRGFRIELGEIENRLLQHEYIKETSVLVKENKGKYICAYVVSEKNVHELNLTSYLKETLPEYMIPAYFVQIEKIPLTENGKIDKMALPEPNLENILNEYEAPRNEVEEALVKIWGEVLGIEKVGINDNFFELGGHSLKAIVLISKIHKELNKEIALKTLFKLPTIKELGVLIEAEEDNFYSQIEKIEEKDYYEASSSQKRMYMLQQFDKNSMAYNMPVIFELEGEINKERIEKTFSKLIKRHDALRTYFEIYEDEIVQKLDNSYEFKLQLRKEDENIEITINKFMRAFNLDKAPLFRVELVESQGKSYLLIDMHHIISDGVSMSILIKEFKELYNGEMLEPLRLQYKDFAAWQNKFLKSEEMKKQEEYWIKTFNNEIPVLNMPTDYERPAMQGFEGDSVNFEVSEEITEMLRKLARESGTTMHMVLLSVFNILLSKYSGQEDIVVGTPIAGRPHADLQNIMGMFVNTLALRNKPEGNKKYIDFLNEVKENSLKGYENQSYQLEALIEKIDIKRDTSRNPLFDVMFNMIDTVTGSEIKLDDILLKKYNNENKISKFDLTLNILEKENILNFNIEYCTKIFNKETIERLSNHYVKILNDILKNTEIKIEEVDLLLEEEKKQIVYDFNNTKVDYSRDKTVYELFEEQVEKTPNNIAVVFEDKELTYRELNERANSLAITLRDNGVGPDVIVGIMLERSLELIIGIIGVLKAGGAYLPIDSSYPKERIEYILKDSKCSVLLTEKSFLNNIEFLGVCIDLSDKELFDREVSNLEKRNNPNDLIYVIYTSGTTGNPKGTIVKHHSFTNLIQWYHNEFQISEEDNVLLIASVSFDLAQKNIYAPLISGGKLTLANKGIINYEKVNKLISENEITIINCAPSAFNPIVQLSKDTNYAALRSLKYVFLGGEPINLNLLNIWMKSDNYHAEIVNTYGPTECTDIATYYRIKNQDISTVPIGRPINNAKVYILNKYKEMLPIGVPGELCISGEGVSRGYHNNDKLTSEKFIDNPFEIGTKMYKTGDLARWLPDGNIEYLGRIDQQVKIRGFRIELGEIENNLLKIEGIKESVVLAKGEEDKYLCAYYVSETEYSIGELRDELKKSLPGYMIPSYFIKIEKIPLTPNGKINRKALPNPDGEINTGTEYVAPRNEIEEKLVEIWQDVLGVNRIGINDNFFELGGHSLKATILIGRIHKMFNAEIPLREIFTLGNIKALSEYIKLKENSVFDEIKKIEEKEYYETSSAEKRMYMLQQFDEESVAYNMPCAIQIEGLLDSKKVNETLKKLIKRHESLRTSFEAIGNNIFQKVLKFEKVQFKLEEFYLKSVDEFEEIIKEFIKSFDLAKAPLLRAGIIKLEEEKNILLIDMHHIISDGVSMAILIKEFSEIYNGTDKEELRIQYKDYSAWQKSIQGTEIIKKQEEYWLKEYKEEIPILNLPTDYPRPTVRSFEGETLKFSIGKHVTKCIKEVARKTESTEYMILISCLKILLSKYSGQEDIVVGVPIAGRNRSDLENIIGMFVNTLAIRSRVTMEKSYEEYLNVVKEKLLKAYENQDYQFEDLVEKLNIVRDTSRNPIFDVMFIMESMDIGALDIDGLKTTNMEIKHKISKVDLTVIASEVKDDIVFTFEYCTNLYKKETIERMIKHFRNLLKAIVDGLEIRLGEIEILSEVEKNEILYDYNNTYFDYPKDKTMYKLFEEQVEKTPSNVAVVFEDMKLTYRQLNEKANKLAKTLRKKGIKANNIVGIMVERSLEMIVGIIAIQKAGGAYLPINPEFPGDRISYLLKDSKAKVVLIKGELENGIEFSGEVIDLINSCNYEENGENLYSINEPKDLAYIIYTSGSTGKPKGVIITHDSAVNTILDINAKFNINENDRIIGLSSICFDLSVYDIFGALSTGAALVQIHDQRDVKEIVNILTNENITIWNSVPAIMNMLVDNLFEDFRNTSLRLVMLSGDWISLKLPKKVRKYFSNTELVSLGGATEASIWSIYYPIKEINHEWDSIPYGRPLANQKFYVLNKQLQICPYGVQGELYIGGIGLAKGYMNDEEKTKESFINHKKYGTLYKTGDFGILHEEGYIEFLGRKDAQIKIRGYRIEIGEVEEYLEKHQMIRNAIVLQKESESRDKYLVGYIETDKMNFAVIEGKKRYILPNNMGIVHLNKNETDFMYDEIFVEQTYIKHGIQINDGDCIFDVGANIGMFSLFINQLHKNIKVFSFEPVPNLFELLEINTSLYNNHTRVFKCGLSNESNQATFTFYPKASIMSGMYSDISREKEAFNKAMNSGAEMESEKQEDLSELLEERFKVQEIVCELRRLSEIIKENNVEQIDLLKIDVEKSEMDVLNGIDEDDWGKIKQLVVEVYDVNGRLSKIVQMLGDKGYNVSIDKDDELESINMYNVYAVSKSEENYISAELPILEDHILTKEKIYEFLKKNLPDYMIPTYFVQLEKMPLTLNGKIDRMALSKLEANMNSNFEYEAPGNEREEELVEIWREILGRDKIGIKDNFFDLGGHSLKATSLISRIHKEFGVELSLGKVFKFPTVKEISEYIGKEEVSVYKTIKPVEEKEYYELSAAQNRMYMLQEFDKESVAYNIPGSLEIVGKIEIPRIEEAFIKLIKRHESLRTSFCAKEYKIRQKINKLEEIEFNIKKIEVKSEEEVKERIHEFVKPFDLKKAPLLRVAVISIEKDRHIMLFDMHHIISDGISMAILTKEFSELLGGKELEELNVQYKDYSAWQIRKRESKEYRKQEEYWLREFSKEIPVLKIPTDFTRPKVKDFNGDNISFVLDKEITKGLKDIAKETGSTMYMVLLANINILLSKYSGQEDIIIGSPIAGRNHRDLENVIGLFVNTLAIRNTVDSELNFKEYLKLVKEKSLNAYENQDYQFEELVEKVNVNRDLSRNPLFDVMFVLQNTGETNIEVEELTFKAYDNTNNNIEKFDITITAVEGDEEICLNLSYATSIYKHETIEKMIVHFLNIIKGIVKNTEARIKDIEMLTKEEKHKLLMEFNDTSVVYSKDKTIHELFEEQVEKTPNNIAVVFEDTELTYREVNKRANLLARILRKKGVGPDVIVGIMLERSIEMIIGIMGILKAGGAYLPIDPEYPDDRIDYILRNSEAKIVLTQSKFEGKMHCEIEICNVDNQELYKGSNDNLDRIGNGNNLAYVIYTSGTTGNPKGVMIEHSNVINLISGLKDHIYCKYDYKFKIALVASYIFDASVQQIFSSLLLGNSLYIISEDARKDGNKLIKFYLNNEIDVTDGTPTHLTMIVNSDLLENNNLKIKHFIIGGEKLSKNIVEKLYKKIGNNKPIITNVYGPTECCVDTTYINIDSYNYNQFLNIPIGKPLNNYKIYILNGSEICPIGVVGELCISGEGIARGYLKNENLTLEKFIDNPYEPGQKMYKTGDLARWLQDGNIDYLGRIDNQVKIRGFRIELGEIESNLLKMESVKDAVVLEKGDGENKYLCAYYVSEIEYSVRQLREKLKKYLPDYMIPSYFIKLEKMPLTPNGKMDRKALPNPEGNINTGAEYEAPRNKTEEKLVEIWQSVLGVRNIGINDKFFELGGHSILLIKLYELMKNEISEKLKVVDIFDYQSIRDLSEYIEKLEKEEIEKTDDETQMEILRKLEQGEMTEEDVIKILEGEF